MDPSRVPAITDRSRIILLVALFFFLVLGIYALLSGYLLLDEARARRSWTGVRGVVIRSEVIGQRAYRPNVVYSYLYQESSYIDSSSLEPVPFGSRATKLQKAKIQIASYHPGDSLAVFVNPNHPAESTLHPGVTWDAYARTGTGIFFILGALISLGWMGARNRNIGENRRSR